MKTDHAHVKSIIQYLYTTLICIGTALVCWSVADFVAEANIVMLFLLAVAIVAALMGKGPAIAAGLLNVALFDFLFVTPRFSFAAQDTQYLITFLVMLAVGLIIGQLSNVLKQELGSSLQREQHIKSLYDVARQLAGVMTQEQVIAALRTCLEQSLPDSSVMLFLPDNHGQWQHLPITSNCQLNVDECQVANAYTTGLMQNITSDSSNKPITVYLPLCGSTRTRGVLAVNHTADNSADDNNPAAFLQALASLAATTLERLHYVDVAQTSELQIRSEQLRNSILSALSHDLRTPLTVMCGMTESLLLMQNQLPPDTHDMLNALRTHAFRLEKMVANLLEMARLESGKVNPRYEWQPIEEVIGSSIRLLGEQLACHPVNVDVEHDMPMLHLDAILMERVFCNLLENACKYSPPNAAINIRARVNGQTAEIRVLNEGKGFPDADGDILFEKFRRGPDDTMTTGFGMGLAICRSIIDIHGGTIMACNPAEGGACICFTLPLGLPPVINLPASETSGTATGEGS